MKNRRNMNRAMAVLVLTLVFGILLSAMLALEADAKTMRHWAYLRNPRGEIIGTVPEGGEVDVFGICQDNPARSLVYDYTNGKYGTLANVYIFGGTAYQYEHPLEYAITVRIGTVSDYDSYFEKTGKKYGYPTFNYTPPVDENGNMVSENIEPDYQRPWEYSEKQPWAADRDPEGNGEPDQNEELFTDGKLDYWDTSEVIEFTSH